VPTRSRAIPLVLCLAALAMPAGAVESIAAYLLPVIDQHGVDVAILDYYEARRLRRGDFDFGERELQRLGVRLLREKRYHDALAILSLNVEMFPLSPNAHATLAEAYVRMGETGRAKKQYLRALSLTSRRDAASRVPGGTWMERHIRTQLQRIELYPVYEPLVGIYRVEDGRILSVSITEPNHGRVPPVLRLVELPSGRARTLHKRSDLAYFTGPGLDLKSPVEERLEFARPSKDAPADRVRIRAAASTTTAERIPVPSEPVVFNNGDVELSGTLIMPDSPAPRPAVILVHGSGKATRNSPGFGELAHFLALNGYAALRYDKRGWGDSAIGESNTPVLRDLAGDALAAFRYLSSRGDVDPGRIGFAGFSEGAWVAGIAAASRSIEPQFVILLSGGGIPPWRQEIYRVEAELRAAGFSEADVEKALEFMQRKFAVASTGADWEGFSRLMDASRREAWFKYAAGWPSADFAQMAWLEVLGYEPDSLLRQVSAPVLAILGEKDLLTPPAETRDALETAFDDDRSGLLRVTVLADANHLLLEADVGKIRFTDELSGTRRYAAGYFETIATWLAGRPGAKGSAPTEAK
jgi:uncharacterized protein